MSVSDKASEIAAKTTGLRPDQIKRAVEVYREASAHLHAEPDWTALSHMCFRGAGGLHQYIDAAGTTKVCLQIEEAKGEQERVYVLGGKAYETFGEAREAELKAEAKYKPYSVRPSIEGE